MTARETAPSRTITPSDDLRRLVFGYRVSQALYAVAE
jgi:hypothetical protein